MPVLRPEHPARHAAGRLPPLLAVRHDVPSGGGVMAIDHDAAEARLLLAENPRRERVLASRRVLRAARSLADLRALLNMTGLNNPPRKEA
ncbi:hypothetical protein ACFXKC_28320 [Streptomyces sp. NPDC059340]|uniref:hypothetical protein n=1 Tax=Streptomyces sp. NPDC059340 TaxID=3346806 RepID=UPI0036A019EE